MLAHRLRDRAEDHAGLGELVLVGGGDRNRIEHRVDRDPRPFDAGENRLLLQGDAELLEGLQQLGIDLVERSRVRPPFLGAE